MDDTFSGFDSTQTATGAPAETKSEGVVSVLIRQLLDGPEGNFQMFGMSFGMVVCVGIVRTIETSSTKITYVLEDHTGRIEAHYWLEEGDALKAPDIMLNNYAKIYASIRAQGGSKTLMVIKMSPVTSPNEVNTHILEVLNASYQAEKFAASDNDYSSNFNVGGNFNSGGKSANNGDGDNDRGLQGKHLAVYQAVKSHISEEGITRMELERKFSHIRRDEISNILDFMVSEGHIYSSIDSDHFLCTE